jgi:gamma-glutamyltranspeptidase/glutathione hydrolase
MDAAVGTTFCVGVVGMYHSGVGGGGFLVVRTPGGAHEVIDFRETAPAAAHEDMYQGNSNGSMYGGLAVAVPGEVRGLEHAHAKYGRLPWADVLAGAVGVARDGFVVSDDLERYMARSIAVNGGGFNFLEHDPDFAADFAPKGTLLKAGELMTRKRYAATLDKIAKHGSEALYAGPVAESIIATIRARNGTMTLDDLASYNVTIRDAVVTTYRDEFRLVSAPAPASGSVALQILKIMEMYPPSGPFFAPEQVPSGLSPEEAVEGRFLALHRFDEAMRFGYASRLHLADPAFVPEAADLEAAMLAPETLKSIHARLRNDSTLPVAAYDPRRALVAPPRTQGTSHIVAADAAGMAVGLTTTINSLFGSLVVDPLSGIILNNQMDDFSKPGERNFFDLEPSPENYIRPGKRPFSSISPIIVERTTPEGPSTFEMTVGAAGGSRIATASAQVAWRVVEHGAHIAAAIAAPRIHNQLLPNVTYLEPDFDRAAADSLRGRGHVIEWDKPFMSAVQGLALRPGGLFEASGETRQYNSAGYAV